MAGYLYILSNQKNGTLYIGASSALVKRIWEHKNKFIPGFSQKYHLNRLVYYEQFGDVISARARERQLKKWKRSWKIDLIEKDNPTWKDLYPSIIGFSGPPGQARRKEEKEPEGKK
ncbi:GIY-YIG nuclease family protein [candidate division Kazan bacterium]|uniref:GIY-YIG nuclease family protein n=1 Tax=candidate division Kazan bacterium TaxID=2202143 RepID=A0A420ZDU7_UNCK3|nr:MAG: GIY-YIG nuclease family protein [candidate division Kazan bacterium]